MSGESMWAPSNASQAPQAVRRSNGGPPPRGSNNARGRGHKRGSSNGAAGGVGPGGWSNGPAPAVVPNFQREVAPHLSSAQGGHGPSSHPVNLHIPSNSADAHGARHGGGGGGSGGGGNSRRAKEKEALWNSLWGDDADDGKVKGGEDVKVESVKPEVVRESVTESVKGKTLLQRMEPAPSIVSPPTQAATPAKTSMPKPNSAASTTSPATEAEKPDLFANREGASASRWAPKAGDTPVSLAPVRGGGAGRGRGGRNGTVRGGGTDSLIAAVGGMSIKGIGQGQGQASLPPKPTSPTSTDRALPPHLTEPTPTTIAAASAPPTIAEPLTITHSPVSSPPELKTILSGTITTFAQPAPAIPAFVHIKPESPVTPHKAVPLDRIDPATVGGGTTTNWADDDDDEAALEAELEEMKAQWGMSEGVEGKKEVEDVVDVPEKAETASDPPLDTPQPSRPTSPTPTTALAPATVSIPHNRQAPKPPANLALKAIGNLHGGVSRGGGHMRGGPPPTGPRNGRPGPPPRVAAELLHSQPAPTTQQNSSPPITHATPTSAPINRQPAKERPKANIKNDAFLRMSGGMFAGGRGGGGPRRGRGRGGAAGGGEERGGGKAVNEA